MYDASYGETLGESSTWPTHQTVAYTATTEPAVPSAGDYQNGDYNTGNVEELELEHGEEQEQGEIHTTFFPAEHWLTAEVPETDSDADSALGDDSASCTASLSSSIMAYRTIFGRTYHSERGNAHYWASNDDMQNEALDMQHHLLLMCAHNRLYQSPLDRDNLTKALDIATGTGVWAMDFADENPNCEVIGTDISPIQPTWVPPNLKFEIEDCAQSWTFNDDEFDFVHMRLLYGSIVNWHELFREAYRVTASGGWCESMEGSPTVLSDDGTVRQGTAFAEWGKFFIEFGRRIGRTFEVLELDLQVRAMEAAGFVDIRTWSFKVPVGPWPRDRRLAEIGRFSMAAFKDDFEGFVAVPASEVQGWDETQVKAFCTIMRKEADSAQMHAYYWMRAVWGRKPENASESG